MLSFPPELDLQKFLSDYWQKKPLLIRGALDVPDVLPPEELAGLACEPDVESRIVIENGETGPWEVRHGPFDADEFSSLPEFHWTLLVQDVDKWVPDVARFAGLFRFLPDWRIDDVMISYAVDGGSVGPHTDDYDVFLVQARGQRRWSIHERTTSASDLIPELDLRILKHFEPEQEWTLNPGDILYLPPRIAHWGVALGECVTWSVGFRAPSMREMASAWFEHLMPYIQDQRYGDPGISVQSHPAELPSGAIRQASQLVDQAMEQLRASGNPAFVRWFLTHVSESKEHVAPLPPETPMTLGKLTNALKLGRRIVRAPGTRILFHREDETLLLAVTGEVMELPSRLTPLVERISLATAFQEMELTPWIADPEAMQTVTDLYNAGQLELYSNDDGA